jgi:lipopolysaccharide transport system permease protein
MFATPVLYPISFVQNKIIATILNLNPMVGAAQLSRAFIDGTPVFNSEVLLSLAMSLVFFFGGLAYFRRTESYFADIA